MVIKSRGVHRPHKGHANETHNLMACNALPKAKHFRLTCKIKLKRTKIKKGNLERKTLIQISKINARRPTQKVS